MSAGGEAVGDAVGAERLVALVPGRAQAAPFSSM